MSAPVSVAGMIDHTLLGPVATRDHVLAACDEAVRFGFATVCVNGVWVRDAVRRLSSSTVGVCTVIGFPLGANTASVKFFEAETAIADGATELDMVIDIGGLKGGEDARVLREIESVAGVAHDASARLKVILETALLTDDEKVRGCELAVSAGADFVKTSTGFAGGATVVDVALLRRAVGPFLGVKASGGIRTLADVQSMIAAGATRIGTSNSVAIVAEVPAR